MHIYLSGEKVTYSEEMLAWEEENYGDDKDSPIRRGREGIFLGVVADHPVNMTDPGFLCRVLWTGKEEATEVHTDNLRPI